MLNIAMVSRWHVHADQYAKEIGETPGVKIAAVWDDDISRGEQWASALGCDFYEDYDALLANPEIDGVAVVSSTNLHPQLLMKAANAKKHIYTEKVLAFSKRDAEKIREAVVKNNIHFTISLPHKTMAGVLQAKKMVDGGEIGRVMVAPVHTDRIAAGIAGHVDVARGVADVHRARRRASQLFNGGEQPCGVGLAWEVLRAAFPMLHIHSVGETLVHDELHASIELVRQHAEPCPSAFELGNRLGNALVGLGQAIPVLRVEFFPTAHGCLDSLLIGILGNGLVHERLHAVAHIAKDLGGRALGKAALAQHGIREDHEVG